jgi:inositol-phosphate transport system permease protein
MHTTPATKRHRLRAALGTAPVDLITQHPWSAIVLVNGLTGAPLGLVMFTAAIASIPRDLLRAARVDGATMSQMEHFDIPSTVQLSW